MGNSSKDDTVAAGETSSSDSQPHTPIVYVEGEKVLAFHGPRLYEAKLQKAELRNNERKYFVHYLGWNKNWDEWVSVDRLMKHTEENLLKQQALDQKQGVDKNIKSGRSSHPKPKGSTGAKGKKRKNDSGIEKDAVSSEKLAKIQIPSTLKKQLVDDCDYVTEQDKLVKLPRSPTVDEILSKYLDYRSKKDGMTSDSVAEMLKGVRSYFDKALSMMLLYKKERNQYNEVVIDNVSPSTIYGAEHLLRLFVKLPELLGYLNIEEETLSCLQQLLLDFLKFLQKNQSLFFLSAYSGVEIKGEGER